MCGTVRHQDGIIVLDLGGQGHELLIKPFRTLSYCYLVNVVAVQLERYRSVRPQQAPPLRFPASRSTRRSRWQGRIVRWQRHKGPVGWHTERAGHRDPLKRRMGRRRLRGVLSWRSSPGSRERPPVATMVANQASDTARTLGLDAANRRVITQFSQQPAKTHSLTGTTRNA